MRWAIKHYSACDVSLCVVDRGDGIPDYDLWRPKVQDAYGSCAARVWNRFNVPFYQGLGFPDLQTMDDFIKLLYKSAVHPGYSSEPGAVIITGIIADYQMWNQCPPQGSWFEKSGFTHFIIKRWLNKVHNDGKGHVNLFAIDTEEWLKMWKKSQRKIYEEWWNGLKAPYKAPA